MEQNNKDREDILNTRFIHRQLRLFDKTADKASMDYIPKRIALLTELAKNSPGAKIELGVYNLKMADYDKAFRWFKDATGDGSDYSLHNVQPRACIYLGDCYINGWGVERNEKEAQKWYELGVKVWHEYEKYL